MQFEGSVTIDATREEVWNFLTNPEEVSQCAPGLQSLEIIEPERKFQVVAAVGFGAVRTNFTVEVEWLAFEPPSAAKMKASGKAPGSAVDAQTAMVLIETEEGGTQLDWEAEVAVMGTIASLAARMMGSVTNKITKEFFDCVKAHVESEESAPVH